EVGTYGELPAETEVREIDDAGGGVAVYAQPQPTLTLQPQFRDQDVYEVRVYDYRRNRQLVAAIEIVSPSNKDRPSHRSTFVAKVESLLRQDICVSVVDFVSTSGFNLYAELLDSFGESDPALGSPPPPMYASTVRTRREGQHWVLDAWYHPLTIGQPLPTLPIWLNSRHGVSLNLESSYEETCRTLRIA
ncbi:MAG: hypothetical protein NT069_02715, partial [Planctomycetota bacterium]|nr:hypothetical protein [Planctomycetota bacterium]